MTAVTLKRKKVKDKKQSNACAEMQIVSYKMEDIMSEREKNPILRSQANKLC